MADVEQKLKRYKKNHATKALRLLQEKFTNRMGDLSEFMKMLKWRFSCWFNKKHGRVGTLWESRFKSVLVEDGVAARTMAAYIDLNPVRAGMVSDPKDYRWCSYAEAVAGGKKIWIERSDSIITCWAILVLHLSIVTHGSVVK